MTAPRPRGLVRHVVAATLARTTDSGAVVAVVLLATGSDGPGWRAGAFAGAITAPHLVGPFVARLLDASRDGRRVIAGACVVNGVALCAAAISFAVVPPWLTATSLAIAGCAGPLLTGGISSQLPGATGADLDRRRRSQAWDVITYGLSGTLGPVLVAAVSAWSTPAVALCSLGGASLAAAAIIGSGPRATRPVAAEVPRPLATLRIIIGTAGLRRTMYLTISVAAAVAALPVVAVFLADSLGIRRSTTGVLVAAYGVGGLLTSVALTRRPLRGDADRACTRLAFVVAGALALIVLAPGFAAATVAFVAAGAANTVFLSATLASRGEFAPPDARAQVFVWVAALKIAATSAGTVATGAAATSSARLPLVVGLLLIALMAAVSVVDRRIGGTAPSSGGPRRP